MKYLDLLKIGEDAFNVARVKKIAAFETAIYAAIDARIADGLLRPSDQEGKFLCLEDNQWVYMPNIRPIFAYTGEPWLRLVRRYWPE